MACHRVGYRIAAAPPPSIKTRTFINPVTKESKRLSVDDWENYKLKLALDKTCKTNDAPQAFENYQNERNLLYPESAKWVLILLGIIAYSLLVTPVAGDSCYSVPVSLSNITSCTNGVCTIQQTAALSVPIADLNSACLQLVSPDGTTSTINLNITISHAHWHHVFDYNYFTDGVVIDARAACRCGNNFVYSCNDCPASYPNSAYTQCITGTIYNSGGCSTSGSYCARIGYGGFNRYKIMHIAQTPSKDIGVVFTVGNFSTIAEYNGVVSTLSNQDNSISLTLLSDTAPQDNGYDFVVFDLAAQDDFYLFDDSDVNSINTYDVGKLGWYKTDQLTRLPLQFSQQNLVANVATCGSNPTLQYRSSLLDPGAFLEGRTTALATNVMPGALLVDPDWNPRYIMDNSRPDHVIDPFDVIEDGWLLSDQYARMQALGLSRDGTLLPTMQNVGTQSWVIMLTNLGTLNVTSFKFSNAVFTINKQGITYSLYMVQVLLPTAAYGFCYNVFQQNTCTGFNITATFWPEMVDGQVLWGPNFQGLGVISEVFTDPVHNISQSWFQHEINGGVLNMLVTFNNFTIKFDNTVVKPLIKSITQDKDDDSIVWLEASSMTISGTCQVGTADGILVTTHPIALTVSPQKYELSLTYGPVHTNVQFILLCYSNQATKTVRIDYSDSIQSAVATYNVSAQIYRENASPSSFFDVTTPSFENPFSGMGDSVKDFFRGLFNMCFSCSLGSLIMSILKILIIVGGVILLLALGKISVCFVWKKIKSTKSYRPMGLKWWNSNRTPMMPKPKAL